MVSKRTFKVGQNHIYGVYTIFLTGKLPYIWSYTVYIYGSGQPYKHMQARVENMRGLAFARCEFATHCQSVFLRALSFAR